MLKIFPTWRQSVQRLGTVVAITYLLVLALLCWFEERLIFPAPSIDESLWDQPSLEREEITFQTSDGLALHGWYFDHPQPQGHLLYCHGNGDSVPFLGRYAAELRDQLSLTVLVFDYRGYGKSEGSPNEAGLYLDAQAAHQWLVQRTGANSNELFLMGRSLGGAVAVRLAAQQGARGLILQNTFNSMAEVAAHQFRWFPVRRLMRNRFEAVHSIGRYAGPALVSHAAADEVVPVELGRQLFDAIPGPKEFILCEGRNHNSPEPASYNAKLVQFVQQN